MDFWDSISKTVSEAADYTAREAGRLTGIAKLKYRISMSKARQAPPLSPHRKNTRAYLENSYKLIRNNCTRTASNNNRICNIRRTPAYTAYHRTGATTVGSAEQPDLIKREQR